MLAAVVMQVMVAAQHRQPGESRRPVLASLRALPGPFRRFLVAVLVFGIGDFARTLLILRALRLLSPVHGAARAAGWAMALYVGHNVAYGLGSYPIGWLGDRISPRTLLVLGYLVGTATAALAALATPSAATLVPLFALAGLTMAFSDTLHGALTAHAVAGPVRGTAYGALAAASGVGESLASVLLGALWVWRGPRLAFLVAAALCLCGTGLLVRVPALQPPGRASSGG
jgi:MFS family permease